MTSDKTFQSGNFDLNSLFNFTYNFDILKQAIEFIIASQKLQNEKILSIEEKIHLNEKEEFKIPENNQYNFSHLPSNQHDNQMTTTNDVISSNIGQTKSKMSLTDWKEKNVIIK